MDSVESLILVIVIDTTVVEKSEAQYIVQIIEQVKHVWEFEYKALKTIFESQSKKYFSSAWRDSI